jgi:hypothetical protein
MHLHASRAAAVAMGSGAPPAAAAAAAPSPPPLAAAAAAPSRRGSPDAQRRRPLPRPPRITNARREVFADDEEDPVTSSTLPLPRDYAVFDPERGPLTAAGRVTRTLSDELASEAISLEETAYWFAEPPLVVSGGGEGGEGEGGRGQNGWWRRGFSGPAGEGATERAPELAGRFPRPRHEDEGEEEDEDEDGESGGAPIERRQLSDLREGEEVFGFVTDCWLYHGAQVDFLCEYDGLVPVAPEAWPALQRRRRRQQHGSGGDAGAAATAPSSSSGGPNPSQHLAQNDDGDDEPLAALFPGLAVRARVHAVRREGLYRWPVQLELLEPACLAGAVLPLPEEWEPPVDLSWARKQGWDFARICAETGRPEYRAATVAMEQDMTRGARGAQRAFGRDDAQSAAWPSGDSPWHRALAQLGGYDAAEGAAAARGGAAREAREAGSKAGVTPAAAKAAPPPPPPPPPSQR